MRRFPVRQRAIVAALREVRIEADLSQRQLAAKLKEPVNLIQRIEALERDVTVAEFVEIAKTLGVDPVELLRRALR